MRVLTLLAAFIVLCPWYASALSNADYEQLQKESPVFVQAGEKLRSAWEAFSATASREEFDAVLKEQREWIRKTRDSDAAALMEKDRLPRPEAYARTTAERADKLNEYTKKSLAKVNHKSIAGIYGTKKDYVTISKKGAVYAVTIHTAGGGKGPDSWECNFEGEAPLKDNVLSFTDPAFTVTLSANGSVVTVADLPNNEACGLRGTANGDFRR